MKKALAAHLAATAMVAVTVAGCGPAGSPQASPPSTVASGAPAPSAAKPISKLPSSVAAAVARLRAGEKVTGTDPTFADTGVPVRPDGRVHLELHAAGVLADSAVPDLVALGAEVGTPLSIPATSNAPAVGIVDAWVPFLRVDDAAALPWVVAVTVPGSPAPRP